MFNVFEVPFGLTTQEYSKNMIIDERALNELSETLKTQGWTGSPGELHLLLAEKSSEASLRAFIEISKIVDGSKAHSLIVNLAAKYKRVSFETAALGVVIYMSDPEKEGEASCKFNFCETSVLFRFKSEEDEDFSTERVSVASLESKL